MSKSEHEACVDKWMDECAASTLNAAQMLSLFERAMGVLWDRARQTLGNVTLAAIVDRVLHTATERIPLLVALRLEENALHWDELRARARDENEVARGMRFVLVEFLTVLGNLTADILTPALHADLSRVAPPRDRRASMTQSPATTKESHDED
jgi:hypothetical protein